MDGTAASTAGPVYYEECCQSKPYVTGMLSAQLKAQVLRAAHVLHATLGLNISLSMDNIVNLIQHAGSENVSIFLNLPLCRLR